MRYLFDMYCSFLNIHLLYVFISILIDLSKAFDTLNRNIMPSTLRHNGVTSIELDFFTSYLLVGFSMLNIQVSALRSFQIVQECLKGLSWGPY